MQSEDGYNGVAIMINDELEEYELSKQNERAKEKGLEGRIISYRIKGIGKSVVITVVYNNVEGANKKQSECLIKELRVMTEELKDERWMIIGDFNGHIGLLGEELNGNGRMIDKWLTECDVNLKNLECMGESTWSAGNHRSAIDYIVVNDKCMNDTIKFVNFIKNSLFSLFHCYKIEWVKSFCNINEIPY